MNLEIKEIFTQSMKYQNSSKANSNRQNSLAELDRLQSLFYRVIFTTPRTCPTPASYWEIGGMTMNHRIATRKLMFYHHLMNLPENSLAYEIASIQKKFALPGLIQECEYLLLKYEFWQNCLDHSKYQWKKIVKDKFIWPTEVNF